MSDIKKEENNLETEGGRRMTTFRRTSFRDLGRINTRIKRIDAQLRKLSIPQLRALAEDFKRQADISSSIARYTAVLLKNLRNGFTPENNFFLQKNTFRDLVMGKLEGYITDGVEYKWKGTWRATYFDILNPTIQARTLGWLLNELRIENNKKKQYQQLAEYTNSYIHSRGVSMTTFDDLSGMGTNWALETIHDFCLTFMPNPPTP